MTPGPGNLPACLPSADSLPTPRTDYSGISDDSSHNQRDLGNHLQKLGFTKPMYRTLGSSLGRQRHFHLYFSFLSFCSTSFIPHQPTLFLGSSKPTHCSPNSARSSSASRMLKHEGRRLLEKEVRDALRDWVLWESARISSSVEDGAWRECSPACGQV